MRLMGADLRMSFAGTHSTLAHGHKTIHHTLPTRLAAANSTALFQSITGRMVSPRPS